MTILLHALTLRSYALSSFGAQCSKPTPNGIDYADANITVVPAATAADCCDACLAYNADPRRAGGNCTIGVWHNYNGGTCALKATMAHPFKGNLVAAFQPTSAPPVPLEKPFAFASIFTDDAVMQSESAVTLWGFTTAATDVVTVTDESGTSVQSTRATSATDGSARFIWSVTLAPVAASFTPHTYTAVSTANPTIVAMIKRVMFGDVWVCSGQSNMAYSLNGSNGNSLVHPPVNNSAVEFADMAHYNDGVRLFRAGQQKGGSGVNTPLELHPNNDGGSGFLPPSTWSAPCPAGGRCRVDFSSMCWFFGRNIYHTLKVQGKARPIGLIATYWGGTADELWSSPDALKQCLDPAKPVPSADSSLWFGMISPILNVTIKGAIWYQGEADSSHPGGAFDGYNCTLAAMIADWRAKWSQGSGTSPDFPFGVVQLNSIGNGSTYGEPTDDGSGALSPQWGYGGLRWSQTASFGYAPNPALPNVFLAVSVDTPDRPAGGITADGKVVKGFNVHSPFKQPTAARLARAALPLVYGIEVDTTGPIFDSVTTSADGTSLTVRIKNAGGGLETTLHSAVGFEVSSGAGTKWTAVTATVSSKTTLTLTDLPKTPKTLRYSWYSNPCGEECFTCAAYVTTVPIGGLSGMEGFLPLAPFWVEL